MNKLTSAAMLFPMIALLAAAPASLTLNSATFANNQAMPSSVAYTKCGGSDTSPELHWANPPPRTASFALIEHDADAPINGGFYHWVFYNLPATDRSLHGNSPQPAGATIGTTSANLHGVKDRGYFGACPPPGPLHHYTFTLYALDAEFVASPQTSFTGPQLLEHMRRHILARATLVGTYRR